LENKFESQSNKKAGMSSDLPAFFARKESCSTEAHQHSELFISLELAFTVKSYKIKKINETQK
jgi:hypothetical protein